MTLLIKVASTLSLDSTDNLAKTFSILALCFSIVSIFAQCIKSSLRYETKVDCLSSAEIK